MCLKYPQHGPSISISYAGIIDLDFVDDMIVFFIFFFEVDQQ